jgi:hypothetical protein
LKHLSQIFDKLNLTKENGLFITNENEWQGLFSNRVERLMKNVIKPDAFFCIDNKPFILFFENPTKKEKKLKEIWNFNESPIVIVSEEDSIEIYNGFEYITKNESLRLFGKDDKLNDFSYFELVTGKTWEKYQKDFSYSNRIDFHLLNNIKSTRDVLLSTGLSIELTNSLLGKIIFVRYLIDRKIKLDFEREGTSREWTNTEFCGLLSDKKKVKQFFKYLKRKFNGDLFPISDIELDAISEDSLLTIIKLLSGDEVSSGQLSLFNLYDFSIIPVEFISNVYELFIGQDQQENQGAYYTPLFLVDYILSETVEKKFEKHTNIYNCKVLDPSCGSGIFLVETLRKIIEQYQKNNPNYLDDTDKYKSDLKQLALDNIYGVDKYQSAVNVAIFSIYLTLLDYQEPSDIESFKFPHLYEKNFFSDDFFDLDADFNKKISSLEFDFILGNPPWKRGKGEKNPLFNQYINNRKKLEKDKFDSSIEISNSEIAQAFILRVSDFSQSSTQIGFIATSKILYNLNAIGFRKYLLDQFVINKVFELAPVRKEVFDKSNDKAVAPATILFYQFAKNKSTDDHIIEHITLKPSRFFSLFKVFTIQRGDYKKVNQKLLKDFDYLWKTLVYGTYLDFNLIRHLKESYQSIDDIIHDEEKFIVGQGIQVGGGNQNDVSQYLGRQYLDSRRDIESFWINEKTRSTWQYSAVHRPRNPNLFKAPMLLVTTGVKNDFRSVSSVCKKDILFKHALTSIKAISSKDIDVLLGICGLLNSSYFSYINLHTFSSSGIEREQAHDREKFNIPYIGSKKITSKVSEIIKHKNRAFSFDSLLDTGNLATIKNLIDELDEIIISELELIDQGRDLLNYANDITIPMLMKHKGHEHIYKPLLSKSKELDDYCNLFLSRFSDSFKKTEQKLILEIHHTDNIIGLFFKLTSLSDQTDQIIHVETNNDKVLRTLTSFGNQKITDRLFIQKDIRGFEKDGFYLVKPNEKRLWHKAIAHLDLNEFTDAILKAGKKHTFNVR